QRLESAQAAPKAVARLLGVLGLLGLVLASVGLYAVVDFAVARRTREIGIRMALGARSQQVVWSIARETAGLIGCGTAIGLTLAVLAMLALRGSSGDFGIGNIAIYRPDIDPVALLAIAAVTAGDPQFRERFDREARVISQLTHPHICTLHDVGEHGGAAYLVMEYLEGQTLADRLDASAASGVPGLPIAEALQIAIQIASAL